MSVTPMLTNDANTVKLWALEGFIDMYKSTAFGVMFQRGSVMRAEELDRAKAGDSITFNFTGILTGLGQTEGGTLTGNEEALNNQAYSMVYNVVRHAVANPNEDTIEQARTNIPFYNRTKKLLPQWHAARLDASLFNQLAGIDSTTITVDGAVYSGTKKTIVQGLNTVNAPSSNRIVRAGGVANDQSLTSANTMTLDLLDAAIELAATTYPTITPLDNEEFDVFMHPYQINDLKRDTTGKIQWGNIALAYAMGGDKAAIEGMNSMKVKPVCRYANVNIYSRNRVPQGQSSADSSVVANVRRAVMVGKNAAAFASRFSGALTDIGSTGGKTPLVFKEQLKDYEYISGLEARMIYGLKKLQFAPSGSATAQDFGSVVISTYAAAHTS